jgi:hypothetical protein
VGCGVWPYILAIRCSRLKEVVAGNGVGHSNWWMTHVVLEVVTCINFSGIGPLDPWITLNACTMTLGQSGLPAQFKYINKRRKRNLQGFP